SRSKGSIMKKGMSIKTKVAITSIVFMVVLTTVIALVGYTLYRNSVMESYTTYADTVLEYAYRETVKYGFGDMIAAREMPEGYEELRTELNRIKGSSKIEYLYAVYFEDIEDIHSLHYAINAKSQEEISEGSSFTYLGTPCEEGSFQDDTLLTLHDAVKSGKRENGTLEGYADVYGHMLNGYRVIFDSDGHAAGLICVEIDISRINVNLHRYLRNVLLIATAFTAIVVFLYLFNTDRYLIGPIMKLSDNSDAFIKKMQSSAEPEELVFEEVPVRSGGELKLLADNVKSLADGVSAYMANLKAATAEKERIGTELALATKLQAAFVPSIFPPFPERTEFDIYASMDPAKEVGGDFYDFYLIDDDHLCLLIADVSGKGIPAALFMMVSKIILQSCAMLGRSAAEILTKTNEAICSNNKESMFVTVWLGILEISTGKLTCANAGHEYPALMRRGGSFGLFRDKHGLVIGGMDGLKYKEYELTLSPGDKLFVYTDGVPEATDADNELFGTERMLSALNAEPEADPSRILRNVRAAVDGFVKDAEQFDDLTMLCLEYHGKEGDTSNE
ncbi:MAG: serine/threonine-protein phosphatase, partial [Clostridia bacterium]|nr:serine/threonine-protein phosphatase [Clostridia bacterium]